MLTGDMKSVADQVAKDLGIDEVIASYCHRVETCSSGSFIGCQTRKRRSQPLLEMASMMHRFSRVRM